MKIVDANVLLYAVNADLPHHEASRTWLDTALSGNDSVGFDWVPLLAFLRLATKPGLFSVPLNPETAIKQIDDWTTAPGAVLVRPGPDHSRRLARLLAEVGSGGNLVNDAHLAAIALEQRATLVSYDNDFGRFPGINWQRPDNLLH